jgi:hypothetical protein
MIRKLVFLCLLITTSIAYGGKIDDISDRLDEIEDQILLFEQSPTSRY